MEIDENMDFQRKHDGEFMKYPEVREQVYSLNQMECYDKFRDYLREDWDYDLSYSEDWPEGEWPLVDDAPEEIKKFFYEWLMVDCEAMLDGIILD